MQVDIYQIANMRGMRITRDDSDMQRLKRIRDYPGWLTFFRVGKREYVLSLGEMTRILEIVVGSRDDIAQPQ